MSKKKQDIDEFALDIRDNINSEFKGDYASGVMQVMGEIEGNLQPHGWISTGDDILDLSISNRPNGGFPLGRYINIFGDSGLGKSLIVSKAIANAQKKGGWGVYIDTEQAAFVPYMKVLGVDIDRLMYIDHIKRVDHIFKTIVNIITSFKKTGFDKPLVIAIDSATAMTTEEGSDLDTFEASGYGEGAAKQKLLGEMLKKTTTLIKGTNVLFITTDQIRDNFSRPTPFSPQTRDTAGHAQKFWSDIRLELKGVGKIKNTKKEEVGNKVRIETVKNRLAPPKRKTTHYVYHTHGLDNYASWIESCSDLGIIKGGRYKKFRINPSDDEDFTMPDTGKLPEKSDLKKLIRENEEIRRGLYNQIVDKMVIRYEVNDSSVFDDLESQVTIEEDASMDNFKLNRQEEETEQEDE